MYTFPQVQKYILTRSWHTTLSNKFCSQFRKSGLQCDIDYPGSLCKLGVRPAWFGDDSLGILCFLSPVRHDLDWFALSHRRKVVWFVRHDKVQERLLLYGWLLCDMTPCSGWGLRRLISQWFEAGIWIFRIWNSLIRLRGTTVVVNLVWLCQIW